MSRIGTRLLLALLAVAAAAVAQPQTQSRTSAAPSKPRIIVTADPECDDSNSLVRFLLYSTDYSVEGLVYASSQYHWKGDGKGTKWFVDGREYTRFGLSGICPCTSWRWKEDERFIHEAVEAYEKVYPNLRVHHPDYPSPAHLKSVIRYGNIEFDGEMEKDTPGSDFIKAAILDDRPGPLYITAWGGQSTIARALKSIQDQYQNTAGWAALQEKVSKKVVILPSGDQDDSGAKYIRPNWPNIRSGAGGTSPVSVRLSYGAQTGLSPDNAEYYSAKWTQENISSRGPLGAFWRVWGDGKQMVKGDIFDYMHLSGYTDAQLKAMGYAVWTPVQEKGSFLGEGDSGTFMGFLDFGLRGRDLTRGGFGAGLGAVGVAGMGGTPQGARGTTARGGASGTGQGAPGAPAPGMMSVRAAAPGTPNFIPLVWRDFAARIRWSVTPKFTDANHRPVVTVQGPLDLTVRPGAMVNLASSVTDPDGNAVSVKWWQYRSLGTYPGEIRIADPAALKTRFTVPEDAEAGATIHVVVEATDNGTPSLTHYQHMILTVQGAAAASK